MANSPTSMMRGHPYSTRVRVASQVVGTEWGAIEAPRTAPQVRAVARRRTGPPRRLPAHQHQNQAPVRLSGVLKRRKPS